MYPDIVLLHVFPKFSLKEYGRRTIFIVCDLNFFKLKTVRLQPQGFEYRLFCSIEPCKILTAVIFFFSFRYLIPGEDPCNKRVVVFEYLLPDPVILKYVASYAGYHLLFLRLEIKFLPDRNTGIFLGLLFAGKCPYGTCSKSLHLKVSSVDYERCYPACVFLYVLDEINII